MKRIIFILFALCFLVTLGYADPPARNYKLHKHVQPGKAAEPAAGRHSAGRHSAIPHKKVTHLSDITLADFTFRKNKAYLSRKTRRPIHVIVQDSEESSYDYRARNRKLKYYRARSGR